MIWNKKKKQVEKETVKTVLKPLTYPPKILVAWGEAIDGNNEIRDWLIKNGYKELGLFIFALRNKDDAKEWLMKNGYSHLAALINGAEGNKNAIEWLAKNNFPILVKMALSIDGDEKAFKWLLDNNHKDFALLSKKMEKLKDQIEFDNNDIHKISSE